MLILSSQDLFFSALSKCVLCNAHLLFLRQANKHNKTKLLLLIQNILLAPIHLELSLPLLAPSCCSDGSGRQRFCSTALSTNNLQLSCSEVIILVHEDAKISAALVRKRSQFWPAGGVGQSAAACSFPLPSQLFFNGRTLLGDYLTSAPATAAAL